MTGGVKDRLPHTPVCDLARFYRDRRELVTWERRGRPIPPPHIVKQQVVWEYAERFHLRTLIETGTYLGAMLYAMRRRFDRIISIEVDRALSERARRRFARYPHISIVHGDTAVELPRLLAGIAEPCLFWLDGHFSNGITAKSALETPIVQELAHILDHPVRGHVLLIDDAREFVGRNGYPGLEELQAVIWHARPARVCEAKTTSPGCTSRSKRGDRKVAAARRAIAWGPRRRQGDERPGGA